MKLIRLETQQGIEHHGIHSVDISNGTVSLVIGVWEEAASAKYLAPQTTYGLVVYFESWLPEHFDNLFTLVSSLPEFSQGTVVSLMA